MKYFKPTFIVVLLIAAVVAVSSCDLTERKDRSYQGPDLVEFYPLQKTLEEPDTVVTDYIVKVQLIGPQREEPINLTVSVVDTLTTAVEGTHFSLYSTSAVIDANSSTVEFPVRIDFTSLAPGEDVHFVLQLNTEAGQDVKPSANLDQFEMIMIGETP